MTTTDGSPGIASDPEHRRGGGLRIGVFLVVALGASLLAAFIATRFLYTTPAGIAVVDAVPVSFWRSYHRLIGLDGVGEVERVQDADVDLVFLTCALVAFALIGLAGLASHQRARRHTSSIKSSRDRDD
jgi:hypothetical protein